MTERDGDPAGAVAEVAAIEAVATILEVVCRTTGMGFAAVARVTEDRWIACAVRDEIAFGLSPGGELDVATTLCREVRAEAEAIVIDHVASDAAYCGHPTPAMYGFESYISMPIRRGDGRFFGTLCAIDPRPAQLSTPATVGMFRLFADLIGFHLDAQDRLAASEAALLDARETAVLREQFIAVLGHDLRNPLASIDAGTRLLSKQRLDAKAAQTLALISASARRMAGLIDNVLDFARGRLGGGIQLQRDADAPLRPVLEQVVAELQSAWLERTIVAELDVDQPVDCDRQRMGQLLSNLLANALTHGAADAPVSVRASVAGGTFELSVANEGEPIPPEVQRRLFQPFFRPGARPSQQGLGLGLYIAAEIARAHEGTLSVESTPAETRFTLRMPAARADPPPDAAPA